MKDFGTVRPGSTIYIEFDSFGASGESLTLTGLAASDVEVYKDGGTTQRASDSGYTLLDTDGIDFDSLTGIHGLSINLADNTTAGFWAAGSHYRVVISSVTINSQTVSFTAATFRIGYPDAIINTTIATLSSQTSFTLTSGPAEDDALNGSIVCIHDVASAVQLGYGVISDYTGSTKTVTLTAGTTFTAAASDNISIFPPVNAAYGGAVAYTATRGLAGTALPNAAADAAGGLPISDAGGLDLDAKIGALTFTVANKVDANTTHLGGTAALGRAVPAGDVGEYAEDATVEFKFHTLSAANVLATLAGSPVVSVYKDSTTQMTTGASITPDYDSVTGFNRVVVDTSADAFYEVGKNYTVVITTGTIGGTSIAGTVVGSFTIEKLFNEANVVSLNGGAQSLLDLKDFADDGYDPSTNKVQGVVLTDTVTTYTGNTPQTADHTANIAAILTDTGTTLDGKIDSILADTNELQTDWANGGRLDLLVDAILADTNELQTDWVNGGRLDLLLDAALADTNELQTDWANGGRLDLLIDAIKVVTDAMNAAQSEPTGVPAADATPLVKIAWLFMSLRNKVTITSTDKTFYDDAGGSEWRKQLSDDGTTYTESEAAAP